MMPGDKLNDPRLTPEIQLQLILSRAAWHRAWHLAMLEHQAGKLTDAAMDRADAAQKAFSDLHNAVLTLLAEPAPSKCTATMEELARRRYQR